MTNAIFITMHVGHEQGATFLTNATQIILRGTCPQLDIALQRYQSK